MFPTERDNTLAMKWPIRRPAPEVAVPQGHRLERDYDFAAFAAVQAAIGFDFTTTHDAEIDRRLLSVAIAFGGNTPRAAAACERVCEGWAELGWVAVDPEHRGKGLGAAVCAAAVADVVNAGEYRPFGSTKDHRIQALNIYFNLGFEPVFREGKTARWQAVCAQLQRPFTPTDWGWPPS